MDVSEFLEQEIIRIDQLICLLQDQRKDLRQTASTILGDK